MGGFSGAMLPDFGEPLLREVYAQTTREAEAIADGLIHLVHCDLRIVLLHYAPIAETLEGEPEGIHVLLGSERLALPIAEHGADLVLHGHAHAGTFEGHIGEDPRLQRRCPRHGPRLLDLRPRAGAAAQRGRCRVGQTSSSMSAAAASSSPRTSPDE